MKFNDAKSVLLIDLIGQGRALVCLFAERCSDFRKAFITTKNNVYRRLGDMGFATSISILKLSTRRLIGLRLGTGSCRPRASVMRPISCVLDMWLSILEKTLQQARFVYCPTTVCSILKMATSGLHDVFKPTTFTWVTAFYSRALTFA